jgi:hypothetical protein
MTKRARGTLSVAVLTLALAGAVGPAAAGNGNGNANSESAAATEPASAPGSSGDAPGHNKDAEASSQSHSSTPSDRSAPSSGNSDKHKGGGNQNSPSQPGVKPANNTAKSTSCTTGGSASAVTCPSTGPTSAPALGKADASKKYGNGKTAAQIAAKNGAAPGTKIYGPGNSQPHKVVSCGHRHGVDVHALKSHPASNACGRQTPSTPPTACVCKSDSPHDPASPHDPGAPTTPESKPTHKSTGGDSVGVSTSAGDVHSALASVAVVGGDLPFTGFPLWAVMAIGLALIAAGLTLRGPVPSRVKEDRGHRFGTGRR